MSDTENNPLSAMSEMHEEAVEIISMALTELTEMPCTAATQRDNAWEIIERLTQANIHLERYEEPKETD